MEQKISHFMLRAAKLEFFLANTDVELVHLRPVGALQVVNGVNWTKVAERIERTVAFDVFDFSASRFSFLKSEAPQFLAWSLDGGFRWDSDTAGINSWERLLTRSYAQLRNNIAHGNKFQMTAPFTHDRTLKFLDAGNALIDFIGRDVFYRPDWEMPVVFR